MIKAEERYRARCAELEQLHAQKPSAKDADRFEGKLQKANAAVKAADQEYLVSSDKLREAHTLWVKDMFAASEAFQKLEEERLDFLRNIMWAYANTNSTSCVNDDECFERVRKSLERCDINADIRQFISEKSTGTDIPAPLEYQGLSGRPSDQPHSVKVRNPSMSSLKERPPVLPSPSAPLVVGSTATQPLNPFDTIPAKHQVQDKQSAPSQSPPPQYVSPTTYDSQERQEDKSDGKKAETDWNPFSTAEAPAGSSSQAEVTPATSKPLFKVQALYDYEAQSDQGMS